MSLQLSEIAFDGSISSYAQLVAETCWSGVLNSFEVQHDYPASFPKDKTFTMMGGMYSAGTTWAFNVLRNICLLQNKTVFSAYRERISPKVLNKFQNYDVLLFKGHVLGKSFQNLIRETPATLIVPVRDPRDAMCSLMNRFNYSFGHALHAVAMSAENILNVQTKLPHLILRYESGFTNSFESVFKIAHYAGLKLSADEANAVFESMKPQRVKELILSLEQSRTILANRPRSSVDPKTNWHPNHVGDLMIGKHKNQFSAEQLDLVNNRLANFIAHFRYDKPAEAVKRAA